MHINAIGDNSTNRVDESKDWLFYGGDATPIEDVSIGARFESVNDLGRRV